MKPDLDLTHQFVATLMAPAIGCCELRIFHATYERGFVIPAAQYSKTFAGWYDDPSKLIVDAGRLRKISGYVTINPVSTALLARADNRLAKAKHTTNDSDVVALRWLYIDIDPIRPADISSTDNEMTQALQRRDAILADNPRLAISSLWGCSGNGAWILTRLPDYPNDTTHREMIAQTLKILAERHTDNVIRVDASTKNPSRVACLPGTIKCKGSFREDRPWRMVTWDNREAFGKIGSGETDPYRIPSSGQHGQQGQCGQPKSVPSGGNGSNPSNGNHATYSAQPPNILSMPKDARVA
jgi:hypothetical protein